MPTGRERRIVPKVDGSLSLSLSRFVRCIAARTKHGLESLLVFGCRRGALVWPTGDSF
ncbi:unnamed protein product [Ixodes persulcatus]